jgi:hypothetical protein
MPPVPGSLADKLCGEINSMFGFAPRQVRLEAQVLEEALEDEP